MRKKHPITRLGGKRANDTKTDFSTKEVYLDNFTREYTMRHRSQRVSQGAPV